MFFKPRYVKLFGSNISVGNFPTFISAPDDYIQITSWDAGEWQGKVDIGNYVLISPGVRIMAAKSILIGNSCMFGHEGRGTDAGGHGIYDRSKVVGDPKTVV